MFEMFIETIVTLALLYVFIGAGYKAYTTIKNKEELDLKEIVTAAITWGKDWFK